jgi:histone H3/H4
MRNRALHDALRDFALEAAALLGDELRGGAEIEFDVVDEGDQHGPALYRYRPRTAEFVAARWADLRALPACERAAAELGVGATLWLRVNGLAGERAEPALRAMLERLYEDATSFGFPEERFERLYREVEQTLYQDAVRTLVVAPLHGVVLEGGTVDLGDGLSLVPGQQAGLPPEAAIADGGTLPQTVCLLERDTTPSEPLRAAAAAARFNRLVTAMRLFRPGAVSLGPLGWWRAGEARWSAVALTGGGLARGEDWVLASGEENELRDLARLCEEEPPDGTTAWALARFEMGCSRLTAAEALSDYLLSLRALLSATSDAGQAGLALRVAALCAEEGQRRTVQRRVELAVALERFVMGGRGQLDEGVRAESPTVLVGELERHLRALLRDILCGYLDADLKGVADDILLESREPFELQARDLRQAQPARVEPELERETADVEPEPEQDTAEVPALIVEPDEPEPIRVRRAAAPPAAVPPVVAAEPVQQSFEGVTPSADWGFDDPEDFSAPI